MWNPTINCDVYGGWPTAGSTSQHEIPSSLCNTVDLEAQAQYALQKSSGGRCRWHFDIQVLWNTIFKVLLKLAGALKYDCHGVDKTKWVQIKSAAIYSLLCVHCAFHSANWNGLWKSFCLVFSRMMFLLKAANEKLFEGGNKEVKAESRLNPSGTTYC